MWSSEAQRAFGANTPLRMWLYAESRCSCGSDNSGQGLAVERQLSGGNRMSSSKISRVREGQVPVGEDKEPAPPSIQPAQQGMTAREFAEEWFKSSPDAKLIRLNRYQIATAVYFAEAYAKYKESLR